MHKNKPFVPVKEKHQCLAAWLFTTSHPMTMCYVFVYLALNAVPHYYENSLNAMKFQARKFLDADMRRKLGHSELKKKSETGILFGII